MMAPEMVGEKMEREHVFDAVNVLLSLQVDCNTYTDEARK